MTSKGEAADQLLELDAYNEAELNGMCDIPISVLMAFRPATFDFVGYPSRIHLRNELLRYVDHNAEPEVPGLFQPNAVNPAIGYVNEFTSAEKALTDEIRDDVVALTGNRYGRSVRPVSNLLVQFAPFRVFQRIAVASGKAKLNIFEAGPGAGYLGGLLAKSGHRYMSYDVTQALYLWQNHVLALTGGGEFRELAVEENWREQLEQSRVVHIPWWQYVRMNEFEVPAFDVVYSNSNLNEMTYTAMRFVIHTAKRMLEKSDIGMFAYFNPGHPGQSNPQQLANEFAAAGFRAVPGLPFNAYALEKADTKWLTDAFRKGIPLYNPDGDEKRFDANQMVRFKRDEAPLDVEYTKWCFGWEPPMDD